MVANRERTLEIYKKYTGETDMKLANAAYDALLGDPRLRHQRRHDAQGARQRCRSSRWRTGRSRFRSTPGPKYPTSRRKRCGRSGPSRNERKATERTRSRNASSTRRPIAASRWWQACRTAGSRGSSRNSTAISVSATSPSTARNRRSGFAPARSSAASTRSR